jgi:hypothetical protein
MQGSQIEEVAAHGGFDEDDVDVIDGLTELSMVDEAGADKNALNFKDSAARLQRMAKATVALNRLRGSQIDE